MIFRTLLRAQLLEVRRNALLATMPLMPVLMALIYRLPANPGAKAAQLLPLALLMAIYMVGLQLPALSLGEDKEKRTLEVLLLSPATPLQVILSRGAMGLIMALITGMGVLLVMGATVANLPALLGAYVLSLIFAISGGLLIGLLLPDQRSISMVSTVVMLILAFATLPPLAQVFPAYWKIAAYMPSRPMQELIAYGMSGRGENLIRHVAVLIGYSILAVALCANRMRKSASLR